MQRVEHPGRSNKDYCNMSEHHTHIRPVPRFSTKKTIKPVNFICPVANARGVMLVGDFNDWHPDATPMKRQPDGSWHAQIHLSHGHHHYQFLVDGKAMLDPRAQGVARNEQDQKVSVISVS
jgi:1,4-alpha-glucan branching enzyme